jgi:hypothetical protein
LVLFLSASGASRYFADVFFFLSCGVLFSFRAPAARGGGMVAVAGWRCSFVVAFVGGV